MFLWVASIVIAIGMLFGSQALTLLTASKNNQVYLRQTAHAAFARALSDYYKEKNLFDTSSGAFPTSLANLASQPGYTHLNAWVPYLTDYAVSSADPASMPSDTLATAQWKFQRAYLFTPKKFKKTVADATATAANTCAPASGATDFYGATTFCPSDVELINTVFDTRTWVADEMAKGRIGQQRTLAKFAAYFNANQAFPRPSSGGDIQELRALVGQASMTVATCTPQAWKGVPLDCTDLFNQWGQPVLFYYRHSKSVVLSSAAPFYSNQNTPNTNEPVIISNQLEF